MTKVFIKKTEMSDNLYKLKANITITSCTNAQLQAAILPKMALAGIKQAFVTFAPQDPNGNNSNNNSNNAAPAAPTAPAANNNSSKPDAEGTVTLDAPIESADFCFQVQNLPLTIKYNTYAEGVNKLHSTIHNISSRRIHYTRPAVDALPADVLSKPLNWREKQKIENAKREPLVQETIAEIHGLCYSPNSFSLYTPADYSIAISPNKKQEQQEQQQENKPQYPDLPTLLKFLGGSCYLGPKIRRNLVPLAPIFNMLQLLYIVEDYREIDTKQWLSLQDLSVFHSGDDDDNDRDINKKIKLHFSLELASQTLNHFQLTCKRGYCIMPHMQSLVIDELVVQREMIIGKLFLVDHEKLQRSNYYKSFFTVEIIPAEVFTRFKTPSSTVSVSNILQLIDFLQRSSSDNSTCSNINLLVQVPAFISTGDLASALVPDNQFDFQFISGMASHVYLAHKMKMNHFKATGKKSDKESSGKNDKNDDDDNEKQLLQSKQFSFDVKEMKFKTKKFHYEFNCGATVEFVLASNFKTQSHSLQVYNLMNLCIMTYNGEKDCFVSNNHRGTLRSFFQMWSIRDFNVPTSVLNSIVLVDVELQLGSKSTLSAVGKIVHMNTSVAITVTTEVKILVNYKTGSCQLTMIKTQTGSGHQKTTHLNLNVAMNPTKRLKTMVNIDGFKDVVIECKQYSNVPSKAE